MSDYVCIFGVLLEVPLSVRINRFDGSVAGNDSESVNLTESYSPDFKSMQING